MQKHRLVTVLFLCLFLFSCRADNPDIGLEVVAHPDGPLFVGDLVSFEILSETPGTGDQGSIQLTFDGRELGTAAFTPYGIGGRTQSTFWWVWDTSALDSGSYTLTFTRLPENQAWTETYTLRDRKDIPPPGADAEWALLQTECCILHYITGTAAERDISTLSQVADDQSEQVALQMGSALTQPIDITFVSRVIGHGGFTAGGVYVSYLDQNYIGNDMAILFHHEFTHYYDNARGGNYLPSLFQEGLAVYLSGGHFKLEPLEARAAALLEIGEYIPLANLANDFYNQQHDIGYLEAGSLVQFLVEEYGWETFNQFYRNIPPPGDQTVDMVIDQAARTLLGKTFNQLESAYLVSLNSQEVTQAIRQDLELTIWFFNTVRLYQEKLDPSAYFLTAWLPDGAAMREKGIVADFVRNPVGWKNQVMESWLRRSQAALFSGDYELAEISLKRTNQILNLVQP